MKLLFKEDNFSIDIKNVIGIVDADLAWIKMRPSLIIVTEEIVDIIGENNYALISDTVLPAYLEFYELVRFAIAFKAYMLYAPTGDLAMTNKGRTMRRDDYEVGAFEWQISNHNDSLDRFFYKHMNLLLKYMVKNNLLINLEKYRHQNLIVPSLDEFEKHYGLNDSYFLYLNLLPGLKEFEELDMLSRIGKDLYEDRSRLKADKVLYSYCQKAAVYFAIEWGLRHIDIQMFPKSIVRSTGRSGSKDDGKLMPAELALQFEKDSDRYLKKMETYMTTLRVPAPGEEIELPDLDFDCDDGFVST